MCSCFQVVVLIIAIISYEECLYRKKKKIVQVTRECQELPEIASLILPYSDFH